MTFFKRKKAGTSVEKENWQNRGENLVSPLLVCRNIDFFERAFYSNAIKLMRILGISISLTIKIVKLHSYAPYSPAKN